MEALIYISKSIGIVSIFYLVYMLLLRKDTLFKAKRYFLLTGIVASLILPLVEISIPGYNTLVDLPIAMQDVLHSGSSYSEPIQAPLVDWWSIIFVTYLLGALIIMIRFCTQLYSLYRIIHRNSAIKKGNHWHIKSKEFISPFSFFKYIVYNEEQHEEQDLQMILLHEKVHATQCHSIDMIIANLLCTLHWFNPFTWLYKKCIIENLEYIADQETIAQGVSKKNYQLAVLQYYTKHSPPALTMAFFSSLAKKRILMMNSNKTHSINALKTAIVLPLLGLFMWSCNTNEEINYFHEEIGQPEVTNTFTILPNSTDEELDQIESYFAMSGANVNIKIDARKRNKYNQLIAYNFKTQYESETRFHKRYSVNSDVHNPYHGHILQYKEDRLHLSTVGADDTKLEISEEQIVIVEGQ